MIKLILLLFVKVLINLVVEIYWDFYFVDVELMLKVEECWEEFIRVVVNVCF